MNRAAIEPSIVFHKGRVGRELRYGAANRKADCRNNIRISFQNLNAAAGASEKLTADQGNATELAAVENADDTHGPEEIGQHRINQIHQRPVTAGSVINATTASAT